MSGRLIRMATACAQVEELLPAYDEGDLTQEEARRLERHLQACPACRQGLAELRSSWELLGAWKDVEPAPAWRQDFWRNLGRDEERCRQGPWRFLRDRRWAPLATAAVLALGFFAGTLWQEGHVQPTGMAASVVISRDVAEIAMASAPSPEVDAFPLGEMEGPFSSEILDQALSSVQAP